ncbi:cyclic-phosphate processing receiver domain-containing protein (plasmid) [Clostridium perfringens]
MNKERINLYVDDLRDCPKDFIIARTFNEAISILENYNINILSLDHDLGADSNNNILPSGYDLAKYICEHGILINKVYIHTDNPVGRDNIYSILVSAQRRGFLSKDMKVYQYPLIPNKYSRY